MKRLLLFFAALALVLPSAAQARTTKVFLMQGEQLAPVKRSVSKGPGPAVQALLAGPTKTEAKAGYASAIPSGVTLISAVVKGDAVTLTLSENFATADVTYLARVSQLVYTATSGTGVHTVTVRGHDFTRDDFAAPDEYTAPKPPTLKLPQPKDIKDIQTKLAALGYLPDDGVTGVNDYRTMQAVLAFQSWEGLDRDGVVGPKTRTRLATAGRPAPKDKSTARHVEIYRARGVVLLVDGGHAVRAIHTSTGIGGDSATLGTPPGKFKIYRKEAQSWSVPYKAWLPNAAYWVGGWALHGYADVPAQPASHGCARLPLVESKVVYDFVSIGTPVLVI